MSHSQVLTIALVKSHLVFVFSVEDTSIQASSLSWQPSLRAFFQWSFMTSVLYWPWPICTLVRWENLFLPQSTSTWPHHHQYHIHQTSIGSNLLGHCQGALEREHHAHPSYHPDFWHPPWWQVWHKSIHFLCQAVVPDWMRLLHHLHLQDSHTTHTICHTPNWQHGYHWQDCLWAACWRPVWCINSIHCQLWGLHYTI